MKFISIVVVSLNTKNDFVKTISSIEKQEYKNYEIIIVDGDSIDGTKNEIIKKKKVISKIIIEKDKGIYHAMNKGIKLSSGRWIIFMNSGDIFYNKKVLKKFIQQKITGYDIIHGDTIVSTRNLKYLVKSKEFDFNTYLMPFSHQSVFVNSALLKKKNFSLKYKISSDFDFFYNCFLKKKKFKKINNIISVVKSGGLADKNRQKVFNENIMIVSKKRNRVLIYMLYLIKISQYFKNFLKIICPNFFQKTILKKKYKNYLID
tara:strand:- start:1090 stop:1872 length:783 start_codon:yes stop_codon:yes gene_type:complete